ncbi:MAG: ATP-binding protein [Bacteroidota bacterium]
MAIQSEVNKLSIFQKLLASHLFIGICTLLLVAYLFYQSFKSALIERTVAQLSSINVLKQKQIEDYFEQMQQHTQLLARNTPVLDFIHSFPSQTNKAVINAHFTFLQQELGYQDLLLFDTNFQLLYHQAHSFRFSTNTIQKPLALRTFLNTSLRATQLAEIKWRTETGSLLLTSAPIKDRLGKVIGIVVVRLPKSPLEYILHLRTGLGETGESYVVGSDWRMRSSSRFFPHMPPEKIEVRTQATRNAFLNQLGYPILNDYRGVAVLSAYHILQVPGLRWAIISEIDLEEAMKPVYQMRKIMGLIGIGVGFVIAVLTWFVSAPLSQRIGRLRQVVLQLSRGMLPKERLVIDSQDEIGQMKEAINQLIGGLQQTSLFAYKIGNGHLQSFYEPLSPEDILGNALLQMRDQLQASQEKEQMLSRQRTAALLEGEENERKRVSRELHDGIGQLLTAVQFKVNLIEGQEKERREIKAILDETITEVRRISHNLMPSVLRDFGLEAALKSLCNRSAQATGWVVNCSFDTHPDAPALPSDCVTGLYRIAQEGIHNAIKYAQATQIDVIVDYEPDQIRLSIRDNGIGFDWEAYQQQTQDANGIRNMRERAHLLGGTCQVTTGINAGTKLAVSVPLSIIHS